MEDQVLKICTKNFSLSLPAMVPWKKSQEAARTQGAREDWRQLSRSQPGSGLYQKHALFHTPPSLIFTRKERKKVYERRQRENGMNRETTESERTIDVSISPHSPAAPLLSILVPTLSPSNLRVRREEERRGGGGGTVQSMFEP